MRKREIFSEEEKIGFEVGDSVQWRSKDIDQFVDGPKKIIKIETYKGKEYALFEGIKTGVPVDELCKAEEEKKEKKTLHKKPEKMSKKRKTKEKHTTASPPSKERIGELRIKLEEFRLSRQKLVYAEDDLKGCSGLKGLIESKKNRVSAKEDYQKALKEYQEKRAEYIGEKANRYCNEQERLANFKAKEFGEEKGFGRKFYEKYKKLGEWNLGRLFGKKFLATLETKKDDPRILKITKFIDRFFFNTLSARTAISFGLLGVGIYAGAGVAVSFGAIALRRGLAGVGAGIGSYDLMKIFSEHKEKKKGMRKRLTKEEIKEMTLEEIAERMEHFDLAIELNAGKRTEDEKQIYRLLKIGFNKKIAEKRATGIEQKMEDLIKGTDIAINNLRIKAHHKEITRKGIAVGIGAFVGSGGLAKLFKLGKGLIFGNKPNVVAGVATGSQNIEGAEDVQALEEKLVVLEDEREKIIEDLSKDVHPSTLEADISPEQMELATIGRGEGVEHSLIRQLRANPEEYGFKGDITNANAVNSWAGSEAHHIAIDQGYVKIAEGQIINETRVSPIDKVAYILEQKNGQNIIKEVDLQGKEIGSAGEIDAHEYVHKPKALVEEVTPEPEETIVPEEVSTEEPIMTLEEKISQSKEAQEAVAEQIPTEERTLFEKMEYYKNPNDTAYGVDFRGQETAAKEIIESVKENPDYLKYPDVKETVQDIYGQQLNTELQEKGFLVFGGPDSVDLEEGIRNLAGIHGLSEGESNIFTQWLAGEDKILDKNDFASLMENKQFNLDRFGESLDEFKDLANSDTLPKWGESWQPRSVIFPNIAGNPTSRIVNMRASVSVVSEAPGEATLGDVFYKIDINGDGKIDEILNSEQAQGILNKK